MKLLVAINLFLLSAIGQCDEDYIQAANETERNIRGKELFNNTFGGFGGFNHTFEFGSGILEKAKQKIADLREDDAEESVQEDLQEEEEAADTESRLLYPNGGLASMKMVDGLLGAKVVGNLNHRAVASRGIGGLSRFGGRRYLLGKGDRASKLEAKIKTIRNGGGKRISKMSGRRHRVDRLLSQLEEIVYSEVDVETAAAQLVAALYEDCETEDECALLQLVNENVRAGKMGRSLRIGDAITGGFAGGLGEGLGGILGDSLVGEGLSGGLNGGIGGVLSGIRGGAMQRGLKIGDAIKGGIGGIMDGVGIGNAAAERDVKIPVHMINREQIQIVEVALHYIKMNGGPSEEVFTALEDVLPEDLIDDPSDMFIERFEFLQELLRRLLELLHSTTTTTTTTAPDAVTTTA